MRTFLPANVIPWLVLFLIICLTTGCGETETPPTAIALDQIPTEIEKAFASSKGDTKELSSVAVGAVHGKDYPKATMALEALARRADLTRVQSRTIAGAELTINAALLEAESKGDAKAIQTLEARRLSK